jgi:two-component system sensor histidine kinase YesM
MRSNLSVLGHISFKSKLLLAFTLFIAIPLAISGILIYKQFLVYIRDNSSTLVGQRLAQETANIDGILDTVERVGFQLSSNLALYSFLNEDYNPSSMDSYNTLNFKIMPLFNWFQNTNSNISKMNVLTLNDSISEISPFIHASKYRDETWFREMTQKTGLGIPCWENWHLQRIYYKGPPNLISTPYPIFSFFCTANNVYKSRAAYFELEVNPKTLFASLNRTPLGKSGYMAVITSAGDIVTDQEGGILGALAIDGDFLSLLQQSEGTYQTTLNKVVYRIGFKKISRLNAYIVSIVPATEIVELFNKSRDTFLYTAGLTLFLLLLLAYYLGSILTAKIKKITVALQKFQRGDFNTRVEVRGADEIDRLGADFNTMAGNVQELINKVYKAELAQKQAELSALQAQIRPHFIYNTLESLKMTAELHDEAEISDGLTALGNLIRQNIHTGNHLIDIDTEMENLSDYVKIQNLIRNNRIRAEFHIPEEIGAYKILNLVLQPLVENCILHGMRDGADILQISVSVLPLEGGVLCLCIRDDGNGIGPDRLERLNRLLEGPLEEAPGADAHRGIGLMNVQRRIKLYFGKEYGLRIVSTPGAGTEILVTIPAMA